MTISFLDVKKYYKGEEHQEEAVSYIGDLLLTTPVKDILGLQSSLDWINLEDKYLEWLQRQIGPLTLDKFTMLWRAPKVVPSIEEQVKYFSQRDNKILPYTSCNSSSHAMFADFILRNVLKKEGLHTDDEYVKRIYSGKYGIYGKNNSMSWDIQMNCLRSFGIKAKYNNQGKGALINQLEGNMVAPLNIWHKGTSKSNRGGGHVVCCIDYNVDKGFLIYDPYGTRPPYYNKPNHGTYWLNDAEFNWRYQGLFTEYLGPV